MYAREDFELSGAEKGRKTSRAEQPVILAIPQAAFPNAEKHLITRIFFEPDFDFVSDYRNLLGDGVSVALDGRLVAHLFSFRDGPGNALTSHTHLGPETARSLNPNAVNISRSEITAPVASLARAGELDLRSAGFKKLFFSCQIETSSFAARLLSIQT